MINATLESKKETTGMIEKDGGNANSESKATKDTNKERLEVHDTVGDNVSLIMNIANMEEPMQFNYVDINMQDGLDVPKPKSTWVRMHRVDCGPKEKQGRDYQSMLRKRVVSETIDNDSMKDSEAHGGKWGKVEAHDKYANKISTSGIITLARSNETIKLELPRAWEPLDSSKPSQTCKG